MTNIQKIQALLPKYELDAVMITSKSNRLYATGFDSTAGIVVIGRESAEFYVDSRYIEAAETQVRCAKVVPMAAGMKLCDQINDFMRKNEVSRLGFEDRSVNVYWYNIYNEKLAAQLYGANGLFTEVRSMKSRDELDKIIAAQRIAEKALQETLKNLRMDMTEKDVAAELLYRMLRFGADDKSFDTIVVSGSRSSMPHGEPTDQKLQKGFITIDFGAKLGGYCSDMTRTFCIGEPTAEMRTVYDTVLTAQLAGIEAAQAGKTGAEVDGAARRVIEQAGYGKMFGHAFGHSLGIDIHESPVASPSAEAKLPAGAVISAEPGIYIPGKFGVRIEDLLYITEDGCENITCFEKNLTIL